MPATAAQPWVALLDDDPSLSFQLRTDVADLVTSGMSIIEAADLVRLPAPDRLPADPPFVPTPAMIRQHCFEIQETWTSTAWRSRDETRDDNPFEIRTMSVRDLADV